MLYYSSRRSCRRAILRVENISPSRSEFPIRTDTNVNKWPGIELAARAAHQHTAELLIRAVCNADISNRKGAVTLQQSPPSFFLFFLFSICPASSKQNKKKQPVYNSCICQVRQTKRLIRWLMQCDPSNSVVDTISRRYVINSFRLNAEKTKISI